jgi:hypothetical protein
MKKAVRKTKPSPVQQCVNCGARDREAGHKLCLLCLERMRLSQAERRKRWRKGGLCIYCGRTRDKGLTCCPRCREQKRLRNAKKAG